MSTTLQDRLFAKLAVVVAEWQISNGISDAEVDAMFAEMMLPQPSRPLPALAFDEKPRRVACDRMADKMDECQNLYAQYRHGGLLPRANKEFERRLPEFVDGMKQVIASERSGRSDDVQEDCRKQIAYLSRLGLWPSALTDPQWADKLGFNLRTYQRAKRDF